MQILEGEKCKNICIYQKKAVTLQREMKKEYVNIRKHTIADTGFRAQGAS